MKIKTVSMHQMVSHVLNEYKKYPAFTCYIVVNEFGPGAVYAWCKLLEESYPGLVYYKHKGWQRGRAHTMTRMYSVFNDRIVDLVHVQSIRVEFMKKLLNQPDRMICWLE